MFNINLSQEQIMASLQTKHLIHCDWGQRLEHYWNEILSIVGKKNVINNMDVELTYMEYTECFCKSSFTWSISKFCFMMGELLPKSNAEWIAMQSSSRVQSPQLHLLSKYSQRAQSEPPKESVPKKGRYEMVFYKFSGFLFSQHHTNTGWNVDFLSVHEGEGHYKIFCIYQLFSIM